MKRTDRRIGAIPDIHDAIAKARTEGAQDARAAPPSYEQGGQVWNLAYIAGRDVDDVHRSGIAIRFPRMARWRTDKKPEDADSLDTIRALLDAQ